MTLARLLGIGRAVPTNIMPQDQALEWARSHFSERYPAFERMAPVFANSGIRERQLAMPMDWYFQAQDWVTRTIAYRKVAGSLFVEAARDAIANSGFVPGDIDMVVTVSSTGVATPSIEALVHDELGLRPDVVRVPVFGLGCAGGVSGLALAARLAASKPGARVLFVAVELCTLSFRDDLANKANIVATALFGDGAAAAVLCTEGPAKVAIRSASEHLWPGTLDVMGWDVAPQGLGVIFAQSIPSLVTRQLRPALELLLERLDTTMGQVGRYVCHPGGTKVISALEDSLELETGTLDFERDVLADHGNMSAPTVMFVLQRVLADSVLPRRDMLMLALGPGFTLSGALLEPVD